MKKFLVILFLSLVCSFLSATGFPEQESSQDVNNADEFGITFLHSNDGESAFLANDYSGSVAQFIHKIQSLRDNSPYPVITISAGDNFLTGLQYAAADGTADSHVLNLAGYDLSAVGNHEFDLGIDGFERFLAGANFKVISSNLDFSEEESLEKYIGTTILPWYVMEVETSSGMKKVGFIGATTESISYISSPGDVQIFDVEESLTQAVEDLQKQGVTIIVSLSHLQNVDEEIKLASAVDGVDIFIAGGGDNLLGNDTNDYLFRENRDGEVLIDQPEGPYPYETLSPSGEPVLVVSTEGSYNYIGRLMVTFDNNGIITGIDHRSGPVGIHPSDPSDAEVETQIVEPVTEAITAFQSQVIGSTAVHLDGTRNLVRSQETDFGNLITDAYVAISREMHDQPVDFAVTNGGGIRQSIVIPENSDITMFHVLTALPFSNTLTVIESMGANEIKDVFEHSIANLPDPSGRFLQASGIEVTYDPSREAGDRVRRIKIGTNVLVSRGNVVDLENSYNFVTNSFLASGGDGYETLANHPSTLKSQLGISYANALYEFVDQAQTIDSLSPPNPRLIEE